MKFYVTFTTVLLAFLITVDPSIASAQPTSSDPAASPRNVILFDRDWRFHLGDAPGADQPAFDDSSWRSLDLPHDWSIEGPVGADPATMDGPFDHASPAGAGGAYLNGGVAWYRKTFTAPPTTGRKVEILFDGAYMNSEVWINGHDLGVHPYGYTSFYYDLTPFLIPGTLKNVIAVSLNVIQPCSRWYSGAGIYRHVWLVSTQPVHIPVWGTYVTTPEVNTQSATVHIQTTIENDNIAPVSEVVKTVIVNQKGAVVGTVKSSQSTAANATSTVEQSVSLTDPALWSVESPNLYTAISQVWVGGKLSDSTTTPFGIRTIEFTKDNGFLLNGKRVQIHGVCDHGDLGCLGTVEYRRGFERQLQILKSMGCNAIRTSHNPPSPVFLDLCDRMGFLVMDESFDEWKLSKTKNGYGKYFDQWSQPDLVSMLHRDRNHPSIIIWSVGNEVTEGFIAGGSATAQPLIDTCHREDPTRPVTSACQQPPNSLKYGFDRVFDVFGINYSPATYSDPRAHGVEPLVGSETASTVDTRGDYGLYLDQTGAVQMNARPPGYQVSSYDQYRPGWATDAQTEELALANAPWVAGEFVWTGFDYLGEPTPWGWPARSSYFGINDLCGFPKDRYYFYKSQWTTTPVVHILPHWTWPGFEGKNIPVWVFTNADSVELFLNGQSLGVKRFPQDCEQVPGPLPKVAVGAPQPPAQMVPTLHLAWSVPYQPGILKAVGTKNGAVVQVDEVRTAGAPASIVLAPDRSKIAGDGMDLSFVKVEILDKDGTLCPTALNEIHYSVNGTAAAIAGLDNGDPTNHESFQGSNHSTFNGLALVVLRSNSGSFGPVTLTATSPGLATASTTITVGP